MKRDALIVYSFRLPEIFDPFSRARAGYAQRSRWSKYSIDIDV